MKRLMMGIALASLVLVACGTDSVSPPSPSSSPTTSPSSDPTTLEPTEASPTPQEGRSAYGHIEVETSLGYTYRIEVEVEVASVRVDVANAAPGRAHLDAGMSGVATIVNTTPERNLPRDQVAIPGISGPAFPGAAFRGVSVGYTEADYRSVGYDGTDCGVCTWGGLMFADAPEFPVAANDSESVPLRVFGRQEVSEAGAHATVDVFEARRPITLVMYWSRSQGRVPRCSGMEVHISALIGPPEVVCRPSGR